MESQCCFTAGRTMAQATASILGCSRYSPATHRRLWSAAGNAGGAYAAMVDARQRTEPTTGTSSGYGQGLGSSTALRLAGRCQGAPVAGQKTTRLLSDHQL